MQRTILGANTPDPPLVAQLPSPKNFPHGPIESVKWTPHLNSCSEPIVSMKTNPYEKIWGRQRPRDGHWTPLAFVILSVMLLSLVRFALGQGLTGNSHHPMYDLKKPPPVSLVEAYHLATTHLGEATNRVYCVGATCSGEETGWSAGWVFEFSNTSGQHAVVKVFFSNKDVWTDPKTADALK